MNTRRSSGVRFGVGLLLLTIVAVVPLPAFATGLAEQALVVAQERRRPTLVILPSAMTQAAASAPTSCVCGAFTCKGQEFPACSVQCAEPQTAVCDCGFCERTMGSPNSDALGPVANACGCQ